MAMVTRRVLTLGIVPVARAASAAASLTHFVGLNLPSYRVWCRSVFAAVKRKVGHHHQWIDGPPSAVIASFPVLSKG
jgi:hypothetical protein